jgi:hypothetical protein
VVAAFADGPQRRAGSAVARPNANWDFGVSASYIDAKLTSSVTSTPPDGTTVVVGGPPTAIGCRPPQDQAAASVGYTLPVMATRTSSPT